LAEPKVLAMTPPPTPPKAKPVGEAQPARRNLLKLAWLAMGAASTAHAQTSPASPPAMPSMGSRLPLPDLPLLDGSTLRPADLAGKLVVLYWWASWCPFCAVQSPLIDQLQRSQRNRGLRVVGLSIDKKAEDAAAYLTAKGYAFASTWHSPELARVLPKPKGLPVVVVIGRDGRVVYAEAGQMFQEDVEGLARFL
jgi:thiol-disulfide isomerase/thioredoxin